jgi:hypothetical protein
MRDVRPTRTLRTTAIALVLALAGLGLAGCSGGDESATRDATSDPSTIQLSAGDQVGLAQMREEEKLAHDVYTVLADRFGVNVFESIASSEQTHTDAVKALLDQYGLPDPAAGTTAGTFSDPEIQTLYDDLVEQGSRSLVDAFTVGATIEDLDIADLRGLATEVTDIQQVYDNLERGSRNHMRAFVRQLDRNDATYTPQYVSAADFDAIVEGSVERGSGN